jgi:hypothetical protein
VPYRYRSHRPTDVIPVPYHPLSTLGTSSTNHVLDLNASCSIMTSQFIYRKGTLTYGSEAASRSQERIKTPSGRLSHPSTSSSSSSTSSLNSSPRYAMERGRQETTTVEIMRCSRCAKTVEAIARRSSDGTTRVSSSDASASGMVRFGHNLYYCDRCARLVGYK